MAWLQRNKVSGTFYVCWREGGRGSPVKTVKAGRTIAEARKFRDVIAGRLREGRIGGGVMAKEITVEEFSKKWLSVRTIRPKSLEREEYIIKNHLLPRFGDSMVYTVTAEEAQAFITDLAKRVSPWTARRVHDVARVMFGDAQRYGYCRENVFWNVRRPEKPHREMQLLSVEDFCRLLQAMPRRWRPFILTLGLTGTRYGEATALRWDDLDLQEGRLHVRRQIVSNTTEVAQPKSRTSLRTIDLLQPVTQALLDVPQMSQWVFPGVRGGPLNHRAFDRRVWLPVVRGLNLPLRLHDLRHFFTSLMFAFGRNPLYIAAQLGHSGAEVTLKQYAHLMREGQRLDELGTLAKIEIAYRANTVQITAGRLEKKSLKLQLKSGRGGRI